MKSFPQDQKRHFRDYVPSSGGIDPKTIRHFPVRRIIFFFPSPNNQSKRKRSKNRHVHRSQKSGEGDFYLFFVVCIVHEASRSIDKHNILTDIPLSSCIVRTSFFLLFFIFFFSFHRFRFAGNWMFSDHQTT